MHFALTFRNWTNNWEIKKNNHIFQKERKKYLKSPNKLETQYFFTERTIFLIELLNELLMNDFTERTILTNEIDITKVTQFLNDWKKNEMCRSQTMKEWNEKQLIKSSDGWLFENIWCWWCRFTKDNNKESSCHFHLKKLYMVCTLPSFKITIIIIKINNEKNKNTIKT